MRGGAHLFLRLDPHATWRVFHWNGQLDQSAGFKTDGGVQFDLGWAEAVTAIHRT